MACACPGGNPGGFAFFFLSFSHFQCFPFPPLLFSFLRNGYNFFVIFLSFFVVLLILIYLPCFFSLYTLCNTMPRRSETKRNDFHPPLTSHRLPPRSAVRRGFPARHEAAAHGARVTLFGLLIAVICRRIIERRKGGGGLSLLSERVWLFIWKPYEMKQNIFIHVRACKNLV